jgi:hypothetical protein
MAHKSHRKHLKHLHAHEPPTPKAKSPVVKAEIEERRRAKPQAKRAAAAGAKPAKKSGIVRSIAHAAAERVTAKPRKALSRAKARVKSLLGRD